jgi:hypothetical protein
MNSSDGNKLGVAARKIGQELVLLSNRQATTNYYFLRPKPNATFAFRHLFLFVRRRCFAVPLLYRLSSSSIRQLVVCTWICKSTTTSYKNLAYPCLRVKLLVGPSSQSASFQ